MKNILALPLIRSTMRATLIGLGALAVVGSAPARATLLFDFPSFAAGDCGTTLTCVGSTAVAGSNLRVTPASSGQAGAAYSTSAVTLGANATFSTTFQFRFTGQGGIDPADGITFVLAKSAAGLGTGGGGLGYANVGNSVAIEFDTYFNGGVDANSNHVAIDTNGLLTNTALASPYGVTTCDFGAGYQKSGCMSNGDVWTVTIGYDGANLDVVVQDGANAPQTIISNYAIDIATQLGTNNAFVGFTGGTGAGWAQQDILNWQLANDVSLAPPSGVPEPATLGLLGLGLAGMSLRRRNKV